jgi:hypothetical protein
LTGLAGPPRVEPGLTPPATASEAKAGAKWLGAGLVLLLFLQLSQQAVESFNPRIAITLLFAAGIGLTGLALEMFRSSDHDRGEPWVMAPAAGAAAAFLAVLVLGVTVGLSEAGPVPLKDQIENARAAGEAGPRRSIGVERVDFRGSGRESYFFEFGDGEGTPSGEARSDEIQVWDVRGGQLVRGLAFEPRRLGDEELLFQFRGIGDIDGDGAEELIGGYGTPAIRGELLLPFAVDWDTDSGRYKLIALTAVPPKFATRARGEDVEGLRAAYGRPLTLTNRPENTSSVRLEGHPAQDFTVSESRQVLINAYSTDIRTNGRVMEIQAQLFRRTGGPPSITPCKLSDTTRETALVPLAADQRLEGALQDFWRKASRGRHCAPR